MPRSKTPNKKNPKKSSPSKVTSKESTNRILYSMWSREELEKGIENTKTKIRALQEEVEAEREQKETITNNMALIKAELEKLGASHSVVDAVLAKTKAKTKSKGSGVKGAGAGKSRVSKKGGRRMKKKWPIG